MSQLGGDMAQEVSLSGKVDPERSSFRVNQPFAQVMSSGDALEAHARQAQGRVYIHLHDEEPEPGNSVSRAIQRKLRPIEWEAEAAALSMSVSVLRYRRAEGPEEKRSRLEAWRAQAAALGISAEELRCKHNKRIVRIRTRQREGAE